MADPEKVFYPPQKNASNGSTTATTTGGPPTFPATKSQLYGASRPTYRPQPKHRRGRRSCCCTCCLWTTVVIILLLFLAAVASAVFYFLYRPQRPSYSVTSLKLSYLNLTTSGTVYSKFNLTVAAKNPNKKLVFLYSPVAIAVSDANSGVVIGKGRIPAFLHGKRNTTVLRLVVGSNGEKLEDTESETELRKSLKSKNGVALKVRLETKVRVKIGGVKTPRIGIRVKCEGIRVVLPTGKSPATASTANVKCKVDTRIKIWKWTI